MIKHEFERYDDYKDSGVEWLGDIPKHWELKRIKDITLVKRGASPRPIDDPVYFDEEGEYSWVRIADLSASERYLMSTKEKLSNLGASLSVKRYPGNFILSIAGTVGKPIITKIKCCIHDGFVWFPTLKMNPEYLYYIFSTGLPYQGLGKLGTQLNLNTETVGLISIPTPSASEIESIVQYLDIKTSQIDRKIDLLTQKASKYGKLKQSLISETVTRGLDKTVAMKDSVVEWIGDIPKHWEIKRVKDVFIESKNKAGSESSAYKVLSLTLKGVIVRNLESNKGKIPASFDSYQIAQKNNIVFCLFDMDVTPRIVGYVEEEGIITSAYTVVKNKININMKYYYYYFLEQNRNQSLLANSKTLRSTLTFDTFSLLRLPEPPYDEQKAIADYLDAKTAHIDRIIETINTQIEKHKELRKTLINDVVTGKIKVYKEGETI